MPAKKKKWWFAKHAKSSAIVISLIVHAIILLVAGTFVAVTVYTRQEKKFEGKQIKKPRMELKKLQVPVKAKQNKAPQPKLRKRLVVKNVNRKMQSFKMPEISGVTGGMGNMDLTGEGSEIGFSLPEIDFFGVKQKGEKVVFVVHFGPATIGGKNGNPFTRMTGLTIRNRLEDMVSKLPDYALFNVISYWAADTCLMSPTMLLATDKNKQLVKDWMSSVNPLEGNYDHCFDWKNKGLEGKIRRARDNWPTKIDSELPFYSQKWIYPYDVPSEINQKYFGDKHFVHWTRSVACALLTQKPDTIFILTTNYIDPFGMGNNGQPSKTTAALLKICREVYGPDKKKYPTINVVVLAGAGKDSENAYNVLNSQFGSVVSAFRGDGSVIEDIRKFMNRQERDLYDRYDAEY